MFYNSSENNSKLWQKLIEEKGTPSFFKTLINIEFSDLKEKISNNDYEFQEKIIKNLIDGHVIQFKNSLKEEFINNLIDYSIILSKKNSKNKTECVEGSKNYFFKQSKDMSLNGGYKALDRSYYFFPWNKDSDELFNYIYEFWRYIKILGGLKYDAYEKNTPRQGVINRIHVIQYLKGGGTISPHYDPYDSTKIQIGCVLNQYGKDYKKGGFTVFKNKQEKVLLEPELSKGSLFCFFPSLYHSVEPIDPDEKIDFESTNGRWFLSMTCVGSNLQKNRKTTKPLKT